MADSALASSAQPAITANSKLRPRITSATSIKRA
eukprot:CAMPEP_0176422354 /NCGR_PEP_ID=MMETSP0127-20121128/9686_1 /TAXON_ID=938130 /ORGANISM="Platyophrya macrostoma, Strain WH" /LENGTH=33 /DNA_ID= /DNA_START= /DNA_END= /DNA_ORIENTATION=